MWFKEKITESAEVTEVREAIKELQSFKSAGTVDTEEFASKLETTRLGILKLKQDGDRSADIFDQIFRDNFAVFSKKL